jgi:hypothetical protein
MTMWRSDGVMDFPVETTDKLPQTSARRHLKPKTNQKISKPERIFIELTDKQVDERLEDVLNLQADASRDRCRVCHQMQLLQQRGEVSGDGRRERAEGLSDSAGCGVEYEGEVFR